MFTKIVVFGYQITHFLGVKFLSTTEKSRNLTKPYKNFLKQFFLRYYNLLDNKTQLQVQYLDFGIISSRGSVFEFNKGISPCGTTVTYFKGICLRNTNENVNNDKYF